MNTSALSLALLLAAPATLLAETTYDLVFVGGRVWTGPCPLVPGGVGVLGRPDRRDRSTYPTPARGGA